MWQITALFSKNSLSIQKSIEGKYSFILGPQPTSNLSPCHASAYTVLLNRSSNFKYSIWNWKEDCEALVIMLAFSATE